MGWGIQLGWRRRRHAGGFSSSKPPANRRRWACRRIFSFKTPGKPPAGPAPAPAPRQKNFRILDIGILLPFLNQFQVYLGLETKLMIAKRVHHLFEGRRRTRRQKFLNTQNPRQNAGDNIGNPRRTAGGAGEMPARRGSAGGEIFIQKTPGKPPAMPAPALGLPADFIFQNPRQTAGSAGGISVQKPRQNAGEKSPGLGAGVGANPGLYIVCIKLEIGTGSEPELAEIMAKNCRLAAHIQTELVRCSSNICI